MKENNNSLTIGVTGGSGFIGTALIECLYNNGFNVISLQKSEVNKIGIEVRTFDLADINSIKEDLLSNIDILVHTAALVHKKINKIDIYQKINFEATQILFKLAKKAGIKKFIFLSTVAVYGVSSSKLPINISSPVNPITPYAISKLKSEQELLLNNDAMKISIYRLPLVCGEGAKGNYFLINKISKTNLPLPFFKVRNKRSVIHIDKLSNVLMDSCINLDLHNGINLLCEKNTVSTESLIKNIRKKNHYSLRLFFFPKIIIKIFLTLIGKKKLYEQLYDDLIFEGNIDIN